MTRFPAEWEPQSAVLIAWPHPTGDFGDRLDAVEQSYRFIATTISALQRLIVVCRDADHQAHIRKITGDSPDICFIHAVTNDIWVRDTAFLSVERDGQPGLLDFRFNGWGGKYPHHFDNALNSCLQDSPLFGQTHSEAVDFVLEGGSVESDGQGTLLTTRQCLLNPNRNPGMGQTDIEARLQACFGADRILWLDQEHLPGDDTDAHIDTLARFCSADAIAYTSCDDIHDPHYQGLQGMADQLAELRTRSGDPYRLVALPMPQPIADGQGKRLPANYANFLIINGAVLVPVYDDPNDAIALVRLADCFPDRKIIATPCRPLVHQYGSLHCMTMQFPKDVLA